MSEAKVPPGPERIDAVLSSWPSPHREAVEWDDAADAVMARVSDETPGVLRDGSRGVSDEDLLRAPLPTGPGEVQTSARTETGSEGPGMSTTSRERDRANLRDLAKLANMTPPPSGPVSAGPVSSTVATGHATKEDSGLINLAALAASEAPSSGPASSGHGPRPSGPMTTLKSATEPPKAPAVAAEPAKPSRRSSPWVTVGGMVAAAAVAAGVFFGLQ
ncbi:MAG: hypothetical protein ACRELB_25200, partial [Polyangiaceae bacterium]